MLKEDAAALFSSGKKNMSQEVLMLRGTEALQGCS